MDLFKIKTFIDRIQNIVCVFTKSISRVESGSFDSRSFSEPWTRIKKLHFAPSDWNIEYNELIIDGLRFWTAIRLLICHLTAILPKKI